MTFDILVYVAANLLIHELLGLVVPAMCFSSARSDFASSTAFFAVFSFDTNAPTIAPTNELMNAVMIVVKNGSMRYSFHASTRTT